VVYNKDMQRKALILILIALMVIVGRKTAPVQIVPATDQNPQVVDAKLPPPEARGVSLLLPVIRVVDGDTIVVDIGGVPEKVRLIGVDTPEVVDPRKPVQCFGKEASTFTTNLLARQQVRLESDPTQSDRDKYGRLLRYVFLSDDTFVNKTIIEQGYGHEYTYRTLYHYRDEFKTAERNARDASRGLWDPEACAM